MKTHVIYDIEKNSIAEELGIRSGDELLDINGNDVEDVFDYRYFMEEERLRLRVRRYIVDKASISDDTLELGKKEGSWREYKPGGEILTFEIEKDMYEDIGLIFSSGLMDDYRSCRNKCIFCFIDQMPPGMRKTLYFKDDDARLSFLQGNYITLTNLSERDFEKIIKYRLSPINISVHTMEPELRCKMLNNRFAGEALIGMKKFYEANITMNAQIVLCKGVNDGAHLEYSIKKLLEYAPVLQSVSVVPSGLTKYREGLYPLELFDADDANMVVDVIEEYQRKALKLHGIHFVHASDEWYLLAGKKMPEAHTYDGYVQLENGVGMVRLFLDEFHETLSDDNFRKRMKRSLRGFFRKKTGKRLTVVTGAAFYDTLCKLAGEFEEQFPEIKINVQKIVNNFFGESITVSGLLTGGDIIEQLSGKELGDAVIISRNTLKADEEIFLDDVTLEELESRLGTGVIICDSSGEGFIKAIAEA